MGRDSLPWDQGMVFVFGRPRTLGFWMRDTSIPLSIAFLEDNGTVIDIQDMDPFTETAHRSPRPYYFAVESNLGWFAAANVQPGDRLSICV